jgi:hypothetical protein
MGMQLWTFQFRSIFFSVLGTLGGEYRNDLGSQQVFISASKQHYHIHDYPVNAFTGSL